MLIKVCGMRDAAGIAAVAGLDPGPDMMGFIFYGRSPRNACSTPPEALDVLPAAIRRVGVFVAAPPVDVLATARRYRLDLVQLHGEESPEMCARLRAEGLGVMKAFGIATAADIARTAAYEGTCDLYVFDTRIPDPASGAPHGGTGRKFDHRLLEAYRGNTPYLLSGGIGPEDSGAAPADVRCAGFDINSRFETAPGIKKTETIKLFIEKIKRP
ncbi:MAG: phosphoribosylanthranilate isomerase [Alistipes sp.]|jgi:phosphoribosylanthranilate isomerase|nr:phosphoribosylanthranilate isomerase [Alistipes sp.]